MPTHQKISVTVPVEVAHALVAEMTRSGRPKSQVVSECLRVGLGLAPADVGDVPSREEFDEVREIVDQLKRAAENAGAM